MSPDPLASMRCWPITVELGGREFEIPALPAVDWWPVIVSADPADFFDILRSDSEEDLFALDTLLLNGELTGSDLGTAMADAIEAATGRSLTAAFVLAVVATQHWGVVGAEVARTGFRWDVMPIGAALDLIHGVIMAGIKDENREKFLALLERDMFTPGPAKNRGPSQREISEFEMMAGPRPSPAPVPGKATGAPSDSPPPRAPKPPRQRHQGVRSSGPTQQP